MALRADSNGVLRKHCARKAYSNGVGGALYEEFNLLGSCQLPSKSAARARWPLAMYRSGDEAETALGAKSALRQRLTAPGQPWHTSWPSVSDQAQVLAQ